MTGRIREKVFQAIGEASMCWSETPKGIFESSRAEKIGEELLSDIKQEMVKGVLGVEEIRNILGWSYTTEENSFKEMDATLMNTITKAIHEAQVKKL